MLIIETVTARKTFSLPAGCDESVIESQLLKDLNGTNLPFIIITDSDGTNTIINKSNIVSVKIEKGLDLNSYDY